MQCKVTRVPKNMWIDIGCDVVHMLLDEEGNGLLTCIDIY